MGLEDERQSDVVYLNIVAGKVARKVKQHVYDGDKQLTVERKSKNSNDEEVSFIEMHYSGVGGYIKKAEVKEGKFGYQMILEFQDDKLYHVTIPLKSSYARGILYRIPNIDQGTYFTIKPYSFKNESGDKKVGVVIIQEGMGYVKDKVPPYWTKEDMKDLPPIDKIEGLGENDVQFDDTKRTKYLVEYFRDWASKIDAISQNQIQDVDKSEESINEEDSHVPDQDDDLPF